MVEGDIYLPDAAVDARPSLDASKTFLSSMLTAFAVRQASGHVIPDVTEHAR
ncbi:MAG TPA: hypothetical protein P5031_06890 [Candidatus Syntrophosphaera sp.]|jgi:hypothetical protein|nr:hypothetical protein [Candidatus Syntrophosphaera sp.]